MNNQLPDLNQNDFGKAYDYLTFEGIPVFFTATRLSQIYGFDKWKINERFQTFDELRNRIENNKLLEIKIEAVLIKSDDYPQGIEPGACVYSYRFLN